MRTRGFLPITGRCRRQTLLVSSKEGRYIVVDAKAILREGIERWNAHDREGFLELYDEKVIFVDESTGEKLVGREQFGKGF